VVFEVDGRAFEAHVGPGALIEEHSVYKAAYPRDKGLRALLDAQMTLHGRLPCGAKFRREGGRASGDFNTGMGNTMVMVAAVVSCLYDESVYDVLADGDNALLFLPPAAVSRVVERLPSRALLACGLELSLESPVSVLEHVRFGQSAPVQLSGGWTMVRDYLKVVSGATSSHRWLREPSFRREYLTGVGLCELSLAKGVPVLQAYCLALLAAQDYRGRVRAHPFRDYFVMGATLGVDRTPLYIGPEVRASFERAFGLSPEAQTYLEGAFNCPAPDSFGFIEGFKCSFDAPPLVMDQWYAGHV
jgi:hypothetical protein